MKSMLKSNKCQKYIGFVIAVALFCCLSNLLMGQDKSCRHEVYVGGNFFPFLELAVDIPQYGGGDSPVIAPNLDKTPFLGAGVNIGYSFNVSTFLSIGFFYSRAYKVYAYDTTYFGEYDLYRLNRNCSAYMFGVTYKWMKNEILDFYSSAAIGVYKEGDLEIVKCKDGVGEPHYWDEDFENKSYFAWHISLMGADWNFSPHLCAFAEVGVGAKGLVQLGVKARF